MKKGKLPSLTPKKVFGAAAQQQELYLSASHGLDEIRRDCEKQQLERREGLVNVVTSIGIAIGWEH